MWSHVAPPLAKWLCSGKNKAQSTSGNWKKRLTRNMFFLLSWSNQNESGWQQKKALRDVCDAHCLCINALQFEYNNKICKYSQTHKNSVLLKYLHWVELKCHLSRYCKMYCKFLFMGVTETGKVSWKSAFCDVTKATVSLFSISFLTFRYRRRFLFFFAGSCKSTFIFLYFLNLCGWWWNVFYIKDCSGRLISAH